MELLILVAVAAAIIFWLRSGRKDDDIVFDDDDIDDIVDFGEEPWETLNIPRNRPFGKWVHWTYGSSSWVKVRGMRYRWDAARVFLDALFVFDDRTDTLAITLVREPTNSHDPNVVRVIAKFTGRINDSLFIGYLEAPAAAWLAENYAPDMPIAAELVKVRTNWDDAAITVCARMPPKKQRDRYALT